MLYRLFILAGVVSVVGATTLAQAVPTQILDHATLIPVGFVIASLIALATGVWKAARAFARLETIIDVLHDDLKELNSKIDDLSERVNHIERRGIPRRPT